MASLKRIEELVNLLESKGFEADPNWIKGVEIVDLIGAERQTIEIEIDPKSHISGQLRELSDSFFDSDRYLSVFLAEAAEQFDDAHEAWLEEMVARHKL